MPVNQLIAQGIQPIGRDLPQIGGMLYQRSMDQEQNRRRNELVQMEQAQQTRQNALMDRQEGRAVNEQKMRERLAEMSAYANAPPEIKAQYVEAQKQQNPEFANTPFASMPPEQAFDGMLNGLRVQLGMAPERTPGPIQAQRMPDGATFYTQDGKSVGSRMPQAPQRLAPETFTPFTQADGTVVLIGSRGTERPTNLKGAPKSAPLTTAQSAVDKSFAPDYAKFVTGGAADAQKALDELRGVQKQLKDGKKNLTGPVLGRVPLESRAMVNQDSVDAEETVANTVQRSLRVILGAQFTQKEGEALIRRAYNPQLSEKKNAERVGRLVTQLERALIAKQEAAKYYEQNGTLVGYQGKTDFSLSDFNADSDAYGGTGGWSIEEVP